MLFKGCISLWLTGFKYSVLFLYFDVLDDTTGRSVNDRGAYRHAAAASLSPSRML